MSPDATREALLASREPAPHMIVGVTGHQRIPATARRFIDRAVDDILSRASPLIGVSSLAGGADQLFAKAVLRRGGLLRTILPCHRYEESFTDPRDLSTYRELLSSADSVEVLPFEKPSEDAYLAAGQRVVDISAMLIAVWDGIAARGRGGTADVVDYATARGVPVELVWPAGVAR